MPDLNLSVLAEVRRLEQVLVDGARAFVTQFAMRDHDAMEFGFQQRSKHVPVSPRNEARLSQQKRAVLDRFKGVACGSFVLDPR
jgi:hypothetical protein